MPTKEGKINFARIFREVLMTNFLQKKYVFNTSILLKEKEDGKLLAVSMEEQDHYYYEFSDMTKECLKMFSDDRSTTEILEMLKQKSGKATEQESIEFLEKFINDLINFQILK
jgi:hypothetical protein